MKTTETGRWGESVCCAILVKKGYRVLARNYRCRFGEIDVIAQKEGILAFVEVKTRASDAIILPREAVDAAKQRKIIKTAMWYLMKQQTALQPRFDVFEVIKDVHQHEKVRYHHIENAFEAGD